MFSFSYPKFNDPGHSVRSSRRNTALRLLGSALAVSLCAIPAFADNGDDNNNGAIRLLRTIPMPGNFTPLRSFDISWVDAATQRYYLADRSNAGVDVVDTRTGTFIKVIKGNFAGVKFNAAGAANTALSGPHGVVVSGRWLFVTDAGSRVVTIDLTNDQIVGEAKTSSSANRADELAYDPESGTLLVINNVDSPPFGTLISVDKNTGKLTVGAQVAFDKSHAGFDATNGAEQPLWDPVTGRFYLSNTRTQLRRGRAVRRQIPCGRCCQDPSEDGDRGRDIPGAVLSAGRTDARAEAGPAARLRRDLRHCRQCVDRNRYRQCGTPFGDHGPQNGRNRQSCHGRQRERRGLVQSRRRTLLSWRPQQSDRPGAWRHRRELASAGATRTYGEYRGRAQRVSGWDRTFRCGRSTQQSHHCSALSQQCLSELP